MGASILKVQLRNQGLEEEVQLTATKLVSCSQGKYLSHPFSDNSHHSTAKTLEKWKIPRAAPLKPQGLHHQVVLPLLNTISYRGWGGVTDSCAPDRREI